MKRYTPKQDEQIVSMLLAGQSGSAIGRTLCDIDGWHTAKAIASHARKLKTARKLWRLMGCPPQCRRPRNRTVIDVSSITPAVHDLSSGAVGALRELLVASDLMYRGYEVFRALSPASPCDLLILYDGQTKRVEVRTCNNVRKDGEIGVGGNLLRCDVIAAVNQSGLVAYAVPKDGEVHIPATRLCPVCSTRDRLKMF